MTESIQLTQVLLGLRPYVLIEAAADPEDGELVLKINAGGGAAEEIGALPYMMLMELPAEQNPITKGIADLLDDHPGDQDAMIRLAEVLGVPMPGSCEGLPDGGV